MELNETKILNKNVNLYFHDGIGVRKRCGTIVDVDALNYFLKSIDGTDEVFPKERIVRLEVLK